MLLQLLKGELMYNQSNNSTTNWQKVYEVIKESGGWGYLSKIIVKCLCSEIGDIQNKKIIEVGSGSGRNSLELAKKGAYVTLLDYAKDVLNVTKYYFKQNKLNAEYVNASLFEMPFPDDTFGVVWNAGVMEHWVGSEQVNALKEMIRICKKEGVVITLNPYAGSLLHKSGKWILKKLGRYPFVNEIDVQTLEQQMKKAGGNIIKREYSTGFFVLFVGAFLRLSLLPFGKIFLLPFKLLNSFFSYMDSNFLGRFFYRVDRYLSKLLGGYLLVSVIKKKNER